MSFKCIISQVHIPPRDKQGGLYVSEKLSLVEESITHLRKYNPDSYIILCGHGEYPTHKTLVKCNQFIWESPCRELDEGGFVHMMPAQYHFVSLGIKAAKRAGFTRILKTRTDCIHLIPNICQYSEDIINKEGKRLLITQQTSFTDTCKLGDCFMYGDTDLLDKTWDIDNPFRDIDGLVHTGLNFLSALNAGGKWSDVVKNTCSFRDVTTLKYVDLRWNFRELMVQGIQHNKIEVNTYHWGKKPGYATFDKDGNIINGREQYFCERTFY